MVLLPWTPPYDWAWMVGFLQARAVAGVERFDEGGYSRSFGVEGHRGLIHLAPDEEAQGLRVTLSPGLQPVAEICYARIGQLFDLACDPRQVAGALGSLAEARPGLRLPGALDAFEQAVRAVLGQLVSVAMAARLTAKVAAGWGETAGGGARLCVVPDARGAVPGRPAGAEGAGNAASARGGADPPRPGGAQRRAAPDGASGHRRRAASTAEPARDWPLDGKLLCSARLAGERYLFAG